MHTVKGVHYDQKLIVCGGLQMVQSCPVDRRPISRIYLQGSSQQCIKVRSPSDVRDVSLKGFKADLFGFLSFSFLWKCPSCQSRTCAVVKMLKGCVMSLCKCHHTVCACVCLAVHSFIWMFLHFVVSLTEKRQKKPRESKIQNFMPNRNAIIENVCIIGSIIDCFVCEVSFIWIENSVFREWSRLKPKLSC